MCIRDSWPSNPSDAYSVPDCVLRRNFRLRFGLLADEQSGVGDRNALAAWSRSCDGGTRGHHGLNRRFRRSANSATLNCLVACECERARSIDRTLQSLLSLPARSLDDRSKWPLVVPHRDEGQQEAIWNDRRGTLLVAKEEIVKFDQYYEHVRTRMPPDS